MMHWQELLAEIMVEHRDSDSAAYNRCDSEPCKWCGDAAKALALAQPAQEPVGIVREVVMHACGVIVEGNVYAQETTKEMQVMWMNESPPNGTLLYGAPPAQAAQADAHELWAVAQLVPGEGIEDGVMRIEALLKAPVDEASIAEDAKWNEWRQKDREALAPEGEK